MRNILRITGEALTWTCCIVVLWLYPRTILFKEMHLRMVGVNCHDVCSFL